MHFTPVERRYDNNNDDDDDGTEMKRSRMSFGHKMFIFNEIRLPKSLPIIANRQVNFSAMTTLRKLCWNLFQ